MPDPVRILFKTLLQIQIQIQIQILVPGFH